MTRTGQTPCEGASAGVALGEPSPEDYRISEGFARLSKFYYGRAQGNRILNQDTLVTPRRFVGMRIDPVRIQVPLHDLREKAIALRPSILVKKSFLIPTT